MSNDSEALLPASSATFALTLDQNVSRDVRKRVVSLEGRTRRAGRFSWVAVAATVVGTAALAAVEPVTMLFGFYLAAFSVPIPLTVWWYRRKASSAATLLNQDKDVAFVGREGLVFFSDDGFYVENAGGWKPWGVSQPAPRRFDQLEYFHRDQMLVVSSSSGYAMRIRVPSGWTDRDTQRVRERMDAWTYP